MASEKISKITLEDFNKIYNIDLTKATFPVIVIIPIESSDVEFPYLAFQNAVNVTQMTKARKLIRVVTINSKGSKSYKSLPDDIVKHIYIIKEWD